MDDKAESEGPAVLGRFAPTPSGRMHLGNALAALLAWLSAKSQGGRILLRVEDLDLTRTSPAHTAAIMDDLLWLGLDWDIGPRHAQPQNAAEAKWFQSRRGAFYEAKLEKLAALGLVYPCFCSRAQLHAATAPHAEDGSYVYDRRCLRLSPAELAEIKITRGAARRLRVPDETVGFMDGCQGWYEENLERECGDFILRRSDGVFAYQLAAPADDGDAGVTEVVRGRDLLSSAPRQIWLMRRLGYTPPRFCHLPLLLAPDGRRLAKRDAGLDLGAIRARGKRPEALVGVLAHLAGLLPKARPVAAKDLIELFSWGKIHKEDRVVKGDLL